jgi:hypothetical protein
MGVTTPIWSKLSSLRGARIFHPDGDAFAATLSVPGGIRTGAPLFDNRGEYRAIARLSRGVGLPEPLPDTIGLAVRICDAHGPGRHQDFLMNTSVDAPVLHHLILPGIAPQQSYSSVLAYRIGERLRLVGALPRGAGAFDLALAPLAGRFAGIGRLSLGEKLSDSGSEALRFNPWHCGGGIRPVGPFQKWRRAAYRGSQEGRGAAA